MTFSPPGNGLAALPYDRFRDKARYWNQRTSGGSHARPGGPMRLIATGQIDAKRFITRRFGVDEFEAAYDVFGALPTPAR